MFGSFLLVAGVSLAGFVGVILSNGRSEVLFCCGCDSFVDTE